MTRLCELIDSTDRDTALAARVLRAYGPMPVSWARRQRVRSAMASRRAPAHWSLRYPVLLCAAVTAVILVVTRFEAWRSPAAPEAGPPPAGETAAPLVEQTVTPDRGAGGEGSVRAAPLRQIAPVAAQSTDAYAGAGQSAGAAPATARVDGMAHVPARPATTTDAPVREPGGADDARVAAESRAAAQHPGPAAPAPWAPADRALPDSNVRIANGAGAPNSPAAENPGGEARGANVPGGEPIIITAVGDAPTTVGPWPEPRQPPQLRSPPPRGDRKRPPDDASRPAPGGSGRMNFEPATIGSPAPARDEGPVAVAFNGPVGDLDVHGTIEMERAEGGAYVGNVAWRDSDGASVTTTILGTTDSDVDIGVDLDGDGQEDVIVAPEDCPPGYAPARDSTIASAIAAPICIYLRQRQR